MCNGGSSKPGGGSKGAMINIPGALPARKPFGGTITGMPKGKSKMCNSKGGSKGSMIDIKSPGPAWWQTYGKGPGSGPGAIGKITGRNKLEDNNNMCKDPRYRPMWQLGTMLTTIIFKVSIWRHEPSCPIRRALHI